MISQRNRGIVLELLWVISLSFGTIEYVYMDGTITYSLKSPPVSENLKGLIAAVRKELSVEGIRFQARYSVYYYDVLH